MEQYTGIILPHLEEFRQQQHQPQQPEADWVNPGDTGTVCGMEYILYARGLCVITQQFHLSSG